MMFVHTIRKVLLATGVAVLLFCRGQAVHADIVFEIQTDTSALDGTTGSLDFQFNPASGAAGATASVYGFNSDGTLGSVTLNTPPYATGDLSTSLSFSNDEPGDSSPVNEVTQTFTFGSFFDVFVDLNIPIPGYNPTTSFYLSIYDQNGNPVQNDGFEGDAAVLITPNPDGTYYVDSGGPTVQPVPEPATLTLATIGLIGYAGAAWRRRQMVLARS
jgi:hypothetical protein